MKTDNGETNSEGKQNNKNVNNMPAFSANKMNPSASGDETDTECGLFTKEVRDFVFKQLHGSHGTNMPYEKIMDGESGSQVFRISIRSSDNKLTGHHVVKLSKIADNKARYANAERQKCQEILTYTIRYNKEFIDHLVSSTVHDYSGVQIIIYEHGLLTRRHSTVLSKLQTLEKKVRYAETISYDLLSKWNSHTAVSEDISSFFVTLLGERIDSDGSFSRVIKELRDNYEAKTITFSFTDRLYPNPYYYIMHIDELVKIINPHGNTTFLKGNTHGDLHAQNIICNTDTELNYVLIDYSHYNPQSFVLFDQALLEADNYHRILKDAPTDDWKKQLRELQRVSYVTILKPNDPKNAIFNRELLTFRNAVCKGIRKWVKNKYPRNSDNIELQFACARIAAGVKKLCSKSIKSNKDRELMLYYAAVCMKNAFRLADSNWNPDKDSITLRPNVDLDHIGKRAVGSGSPLKKLNSFSCPEDFNEKIRTALNNATCSEIYLLSLRIDKYCNLNNSDKNYATKNITKFFDDSVKKLLDDEMFVKFYATASFHYTRIGDKMECNEITSSSRTVLFDTPIFPTIPLKKLKDMAQKTSDDNWYWQYKDDTFLIISKGELSEELFKMLFECHKEYVNNSLNTRNSSLKRTAAFVASFRDRKPDPKRYNMKFYVSLERTLEQIVAYVSYKQFNTNSDISLVNLLKFGITKKSGDEGVQKNMERGSVKKEFAHDFPVRVGKLVDDSFSYRIKTVMQRSNETTKQASEKFYEENHKNIYEKIRTHYFGTVDAIDVNKHLFEVTFPLYFKLINKYILVIPVSKRNDRHRFRYALVLVADSPIEFYILDNITSLLSKYFAYLGSRKRILFLKLQRKWFKRGFPSESALEKRFAIETREAFKNIVYLTNAYSATLRLYHPATNALKKIVDVSNNDEKDLDDTSTYEEINLEEHKKDSINCRTFLLDGVKDQNAIYISEVKKQKNEMIRRREQTMSELCLPFYYRGAKIGVMNFESPVIHAFDSECTRDTASCVKSFYTYFYVNKTEKRLEKYVELRQNSFFYTIKSFLQYFYETLYEKSDLRRLARFSEREINLHELDNLVNTAKISGQSLDLSIDRISALLKVTRSCLSEDNYDTGKNVYELFHEIRTERINAYGSFGDTREVSKETIIQKEYLDAHLPIEMHVRNPSKVKLGVTERRLRQRNPSKVKLGVAERLREIYKNLLSNYLTHGDKVTDKLVVTYQKNGVLVISQTYTKPIQSAKGRIWFLSPDEYDGKVHSGLFIVGTLVRELNGYVFTDYGVYNELKRFDIYINLKEFGVYDEKS